MKNLFHKIEILDKDNWGDPASEMLLSYILRTLSGINRQMARDDTMGIGARDSISLLQEALRRIEGIEDMIQQDISIRALVEYGEVLRKNMWGAFRTEEDYLQMELNWKNFFRKHPDCNRVYQAGYVQFSKDMSSFFGTKFNYSIIIPSRTSRRKMAKANQMAWMVCSAPSHGFDM